MKTLFKPLIAGAMALATLGATAAIAGDRSDHRSERRSDHRVEHRSDHRPAYCADDHDHRSHASNYYNFYEPDRYYRAGAYRGSGLKISVRIGDGYNNGRDYRRGDRDYRRGDRYYRASDRGNRGRVVRRETFDTRYRARIVLKEEVVRSRRGHRRLVCTVKARGPEAGYVSERRMYRIANRNCSPRARVRVYS